VVVTLTRAIIRIQSVKSTLLELGYAYLRITQFQENTGETLVSTVAALAAFVPRGSLVVYTEGRTSEAHTHLTAAPENYLRSPLSRDYLDKPPLEVKNAPMGDDTAVLLTTARYFAPKGRSMRAKGIAPDIALDEGTKASEAFVLKEADLEKHPAVDHGKDSQAAAPANSFNFTPAPRPNQTDDKDTRLGPGQVVAKSNYELAQALAFLKSRDTMPTKANVH